MTGFTIVPAQGVDVAQLEACFLLAYSDYLIGPMRLPPGGWPALLAIHGVDLPSSRVALNADGEPQAFALATPRPELRSWRLATMAAVPAARGLGMAPALLDDFIERARQARCARVELECFAQNERAQRLYASRGFAVVHELVGYSGVPSAGSTARVREVGFEDAIAWQAEAERSVELPYQVTPASIGAQQPPLRAWRCGSAQMIARDMNEVLVVVSLLDRSAAQQDAGELLHGVATLMPGRTVRVPQLQLRDIGGAACERAGLERLPLHQVWMTRAF